MNLIGAFGIYFICWWLVLFTILPIGVRTQEENGKIIQGTAPSAPHKSKIKIKLIATTIVTFIPFIIIIIILKYNILELDDFDIFSTINPKI